MKNKITFNEVWKTLHADLIGKDSHRGITLTYGWMANQVGHFSLGFIPTYITFLLTDTPQISFIIVAVFWLCFEFFNALSPLYKKEYKGNGIFPVQWGNLIFDTFTDLCFFWLGGFTFYILNAFNTSMFYVLLLAASALSLSIRYWFLVKLYQQNAFLPFQFRLSQWNAAIHSDNIYPILHMFSHTGQQKHLIVVGAKGKGKTTLMVGLANELAILKNKITYTTFSKWISLLEEDNDTLKRTGLSLWKWTESEFLVIDDINPGAPINANKYSSSDILSYIERSESLRNKQSLQNMSVAWILGDFHPSDSLEQFKDVLLKIGVNENDIYLINLNK